MALSAGTSLGRYEIQSPLGAGGMGEVYLARDPLLGRTVAIKLLPPAFAGDPDRLRRFQQEAQTSAALNHPRILAIHDVGQAGDQPFIVMEYVRGETLSAFLKRGRPPLARALEIGIEIANALAAAHGARIVHRDLKPANIMVTGDGHIKVLDFGLAKFLLKDTAAPTLSGHARTETSTGHVLGTPGYMSPEQLFGDRVDERTDIYTLGVILFELVTGERPYRDIFDLLRGDDPTTPIRTAHEVDGAIAPEISATIARAMARKPADRFATAGELETELRRLLLEESLASHSASRSRTVQSPVAARQRLLRYAPWVLAAAVLIGIAAVPLLNGPGTTQGVIAPAAAPAERPVIAVLPLENLIGDESKAYIGVGIADSLTTSLARLSSISVVSRSSMLDAGAATRPITEIARNLGVTMLLRGSIQQAGNLLRVEATLTSLDGPLLWSGREEGSHEELFSMQNRLAESLLDALRVRRTPAERQNLARVPTEDVQARDAYWQGLALLDRPDQAGFDAAVARLKEATARDRRFSLAYAALGEAQRRRAVLTNDTGLMKEAVANVTTALKLDAAQPEVRLSLAAVYRSTGQSVAAVDEVNRVLAEQPNNDNAHRLLGELLAKAGRPKEALQALRTAVDLRPDWLNHQALGLFLYENGQLREAVDVFTLLTKLKPNDAYPFQQLGTIFLAQGAIDRARENFEKSNNLTPNAGSYTNLGTIAYSAGRYDEAVRDYESAVRLAPTIAVYHGNLADAYRKAGRPADARNAYLTAINVGKQALAVNQNDDTTVSLLGMYYAKVGSAAEAEEYANRAVGINPTSPGVLYFRAVVLTLNNKPDAAIKQLSDAIDRGYPVRLALEDEDLAPLRPLPAFQRLARSRK